MESPATPPMVSMKLPGLVRRAPLPWCFCVSLEILTKLGERHCEAHHTKFAAARTLRGICAAINAYGTEFPMAVVRVPCFD